MGGRGEAGIAMGERCSGCLRAWISRAPDRLAGARNRQTTPSRSGLRVLAEASHLADVAVIVTTLLELR
jgi:hypothetical protein